MKKYLVACASALIAYMGLAVDETATFQVGPIGSVVYADGSSAGGGECYEVIFTADGYDFAGFTSDGHFVEPQHSAVVMFGELSELSDGVACGMGTKSDVKEEYLDFLNCKDGKFELYILDTRVGSGYAPVDWASENPTWLPTQINGWAKATGSNTILYSKLTFNRSLGVNSGTITTTQTTHISGAAPVPVISAFSVVEGVASVGATNTVATANYVLEKASDVGFTNVVWTSTSKAGAASKTTPLTFSDPSATGSAAFYQIKVVK